MKISALSLLAVLSLSTFMIARGQKRTQKHPCAHAQSLGEMRVCARKEFKTAEAVLNGVFDRLMTKLDDGGKAKLKEAEATWLKYREANCDYEASLFEGGSMQPLILSTCFTRVTKARTAELRQQIKDLDF